MFQFFCEPEISFDALEGHWVLMNRTIIELQGIVYLDPR